MESARSATAPGRALDGRALVHAVRADGAGGLEWHETGPDGAVAVHRTEFSASLARRAFLRVPSGLPIEWMP